MLNKKKLELILEHNLTGNEQLELDHEKLNHILTNLLTNAIKFTSESGQITLRAKLKKEKGLLLQVEDNGRGIAKDDLPYIFDRYFQTNKKTAVAEGGTGIGLALTKEFVDLFNGSIQVESKEGEGSKFTVMIDKENAPFQRIEKIERIELSPNHITPNPSSPRLADSSYFNSNANSKKIIIVEDNFELRHYLHKLIRPYNTVETFSNGKTALDYITSNTSKCGLIISDVMMPIMDGITLLEKIKSNPQLQSIPFIMLTARAGQDEKIHALRFGVDDYLTKPFLEEELLASIRNLGKFFLEREKEKMDQLSELSASSNTLVASKVTIDQQWLLKLEKEVELLLDHPLFTVDYLAKQMTTSRRQLYRKIKLHTGLTPNNYIREVRLQKAKVLFEQQQFKSIQEVCEAVGFQKQSYFSKLYKNRFGKSPSTYL